jgi:hypothetical protein
LITYPGAIAIARALAIRLYLLLDGRIAEQ